MRLVALIAVSAVALAGCGGGDDPDANKAAEAAPSSTTRSALSEACDSIGAQLPNTTSGSWSRVLAEAEHYRDSDDAEVRDLAGDVVEAVQPVAAFEESSGSETDQDRMIATFKSAWPSIATRCDWGDLNIG